MAQKPQFGIVEFLLLLLTLAVAAGVRVAYLASQADRGHSSGPLLVEAPSPRLPPRSSSGSEPAGATELDDLVHNLKEHRWFGSLAPFARLEERTAHTSPGY